MNVLCVVYWCRRNSKLLCHYSTLRLYGTTIRAKILDTSLSNLKKSQNKLHCSAIQHQSNHTKKNNAQPNSRMIIITNSSLTLEENILMHQQTMTYSYHCDAYFMSIELVREVSRKLGIRIAEKFKTRCL